MFYYDFRKKICIAAAISALVIVVFIGESASLRAQTFNSSPNGGVSAADAEIRFQQLEKEIRRLTGRVEEQSHEVRILRSELKKITGDIEFRLKSMEQGGAPVSDNYNNSLGNVDGGSAVADEEFLYNSRDLDPTLPSHTLGTLNRSQDNGVVSANDPASMAYEYAYSFIKNGDFEKAENAFAKFIADYPDHKLVANAKYWYGETFYVRGSYEKAARVFAEGYQKFPNSTKAASNLLKLGMALKGMGKNDDACVAYKQLKKDYSNSPSPVLKRADTEMKRIGCK